MRERRLVFGEVAELYDSVRPSYPDELVDDVLAFADAGQGDPALEVGAGTGKATVLFAARGLDLTCLEPSANMAAVLRQAAPNTRIEETGFEGFSAPADSYKLVFSAQAWHWVDPAIRLAKAHELLKPDGGLALFFNRDEVAPGPLLEELDEVYARLGTEANGPSAQADRLRELNEIASEISNSDLFTDGAEREYPWQRTYPTDHYVQLLATYSNHLLVEEELRERLLSAVAEAIDAAGGTITIDGVAKLHLARPAR
jgi:SAM-dependent methyltransferase